MNEFDLNGLCVFQSNNFTQETSHINCVESVDELVEQSGITNVIYKGETQFHKWDQDHKRYMVIGER